MQGLEVYNANGTLQFSTNNRLTRFLDSFAIGTGAGSRSVSGISTGTPIAFVTPILSSNTGFWGVPAPTFTFDVGAGLASWSSISNTQASGYNVIIAVY